MAESPIWTAPAAPGTPLTTPPDREDAPDPAPQTERRTLPLTAQTSDPDLMLTKDEDVRVDERRQRRLFRAWIAARTRRRGTGEGRPGTGGPATWPEGR